MSIHLQLADLDSKALQLLCGAGNRVLNRIEAYFEVNLMGKPGDWRIEGARAGAAAETLKRLAASAKAGSLNDAHVETICCATAG